MTEAPNIMEALAALFFVLGLLLALYFFLKRHPRLMSSGIPDFKISSRARLDRHHQFLLLSYRGKETLILVGPHHSQIIYTSQDQS